MIYPFDAAHSIQVLRKHYAYAALLSGARKKLAARAAGVIACDRFLSRMDASGNHEIRRLLIHGYHRITKNPP